MVYNRCVGSGIVPTTVRIRSGASITSITNKRGIGKNFIGAIAIGRTTNGTCSR